jgi:transcriptional regulator with XRE-family HTH domain
VPGEGALMEFGSMLHALRLAAGLSQRELAERADLSSQAIGALERGARRAPYRHTVALLADALELGADERTKFERAARRRRGPRTAVNGPASDGAGNGLPLRLSPAMGLARPSNITSGPFPGSACQATAGDIPDADAY